MGTGVHNNLDPVSLQQANELLGGMVGMPDREHGVQLCPLIFDRNSFPSSENLRPVSSIIPRPRSPQPLFHSFGRGIAGDGRRPAATAVVNFPATRYGCRLRRKAGEVERAPLSERI